MTFVDQSAKPSSISWWLTLDPLDRRLPQRWLSWAESPAGVRTIESWQADHDPLANWSPTDLVAPTSGSLTDVMQAALVEIAQGGSAEAGLTLLVQLRPGLIRLARAACGWDWIMTHDVHDEVQATFFEVLFRHNLDRRPRRIAANLLLDTRQKLWRRMPRTGPPTVGLAAATVHPAVHADPSGPAWIEGVEMRVHLRDRVNDLPGTDASRRLTATMAYRAWIDDESPSAIATDLGVAPQTVATRLYRFRRILKAGW